MNRSFSKYLRIAGVAFMVALLSLSGGLNVFLGESIPAAKAQLAGQTGIARPKLIFRESDKQFLVVGENQGAHGVFLENPNPAGNGVCYQYKIDVPFDTGASSKAIRARATTDSSGNVYVIWMDAPSGSAYGFQAYMRVFDPNCNPTTADNVNVGNQLLKFGASGGNGYPDITWSPSNNRIYISWQGGLNGNYTNMVLAASAPAGLSGWESNKWDQFWPLVDQNGMAPTPKIVSDKSGRVHVMFRRDRGDHQAELRVADYISGSWNTYGGSGKNISNDPSAASDVTETADISVSCQDTTYAGWADRYDIGTMGISTFDPSSGWDSGRQNVVSTNVGQISTGIAAGKDGNSVFLGQGYGAAQVWASANRGQSFSSAANYNYGANVNAITLAQGNNTVGIFTLDSNRGNHFHTVTGGGSCLFTTLDAGIDANGYYAAPNTPDPNNGNATDRGLAYYPLPKPIRILETRSGLPAGTGFYQPGQPLAGGSTTNYLVAGANITFNGINIPAAAKALVATTTVVNPQGGGYITIFPGPNGAARPIAATLNFVPNQIISNNSNLTIGTDGTINIYAHATTDFGIDVFGYYAPPGTADPNNGNATDRGLAYYPLPKAIRVLESRPGFPAGTAVYQPGQKLAGGTVSNYLMAGPSVTLNGINIPAAAKALIANTIVVYPQLGGFVTSFPGPSGTARPIVATMNYWSNSLLGTNSTLTLGSDNTLNVYVHNTTDLSIDVFGYFAPVNTADPNNGNATDRGLYYYPLNKPSRLLDTRAGLPANIAQYQPGQPLYAANAGVSNYVQNYIVANITNRVDGQIIPGAAKALDCTITSITPTGSVGFGFMTVYGGPADPNGANRPVVANLLYQGNQILSNNNTLTLGPDGSINLFNLTFS